MSVEGPDGVGKTSLCAELRSRCASSSAGKMTFVRFPDRGSGAGELMGRLLRGPVAPEGSLAREAAERQLQLLGAAHRWERACAIEREVRSGGHVVCDRFIASGIAYGAAAGGFPRRWCAGLNDGLPAPDLVVLLRADTETLRERLAARRAGSGSAAVDGYELGDVPLRVAREYQEMGDPNSKESEESARRSGEVLRFGAGYCPRFLEIDTASTGLEESASLVAREIDCFWKH